MWNLINAKWGAIGALIAASVSAEVLELGQSEVHATKAQPEEIILLSRAPLAMEHQTPKFNGRHEIERDLENTKLFDFVHKD